MAHCVRVIEYVGLITARDRLGMTFDRVGVIEHAPLMTVRAL